MKPKSRKKPNKSKPRLRTNIKWKSPVALLVIALVAIAGAYLVFRALATPIVYPFHNDEVDQLSRINSARTAAGKPAYTLSPCLAKVARDNAQYTATNQIDRDPTTSEFNTYCPHWTSIAGNAGKAYGCNADGHDSCSSSLFSAFMASTVHKSNILSSSYNYVGVGSYRDSNGRIWTSHAFASCTSGCGGSNADVRTSISASSPAAGSYVKSGQLLTINAGYSASRNGNLSSAQLTAVIPTGTSYYSMSAGNAHVTGHGTTTASTPHDYSGGNHVYWNFDYIPGSGQSYSSGTFSYVVKLNSGLSNGTRICPHADVRSTGVANSTAGYQPTQAAWLSCYTVQN